MGNYIRGKLLEIMIVGVAAYIPFELMGLNYAATLSLFIGLSVIIPYVGAIAVTIPVALIAWFQWGPGDSFLYVIIIYLVIQALDANVLVPLLFSEVVNMHPVAISYRCSCSADCGESGACFSRYRWPRWSMRYCVPGQKAIRRRASPSRSCERFCNNLPIHESRPQST